MNGDSQTDWYDHDGYASNCKWHLPAPFMLAPLKDVFPVASAPSKLAFVKLTYQYGIRKFISRLLPGKENK